VNETVSPAGSASKGGRLVQGDALDVARALLREGVGGTADLVYLDPPFASQTSYIHEARLDGPASGRIRRTLAYNDSWHAGKRGATGDESDGIAAYLDMLAPRLEAAAALLGPRGTLWVHLDWRASYLVRVLLDEIIGRDRFINEIVWRRAPNLGRQAASGQFGRTLDTIVVYGGPDAKLVPPTRLEPIEKGTIRWDEAGRPFTSAPRGDYTDASVRRLDAEGRVHRTATGKAYIKYFLVKDEAGVWCRERRVDTLWTDVAPLRHAPTHERTGYPTQKPRALLERIIRSATPEGGLVIDLFAGSGTTGEAAYAQGRRFILGDAGHVAVAIARARLLRAGAGLSLERTPGLFSPEGSEPKARTKHVDRERLDIELVDPSEPFAWAVDPAYHPGSTFRAVWHSERRPGAKSVPAETVARLPYREGRIAIRIYGDEGTVSTHEVHPAAHEHSHDGATDGMAKEGP
jgi:DNA modification methylase